MSVCIGFINDLQICCLEKISGGEDMNVQSVFFLLFLFCEPEEIMVI